MTQEGRPAPAGRIWLEPGDWVRHPEQPDWGVGQVQSVDGPRVTVNFPETGKVLINTGVIALDVIDDP